MAFNINEFRSRLSGGGSRPNMFQVVITAPAYVGLDTQQLSFMCHSASMPESSVGAIPVYFFGRPVFLAGDRQMGQWSVAIYNDESFDLRNAFERWSTSLASHTTTNNAQRALGAKADSTSYVSNATITQLSKNGKSLKSYTMVNAWPTIVSGMELSWNTTETIGEFQVTWAYDDFFENAGAVV